MNFSSERPNCQDCGNKAKRECQHSRCRTCCKSRGFFCPTHVRSTWVPVSRRHRNHRLSLLPPPSFLHLQGLGGRNYQSFPAEISTVANFRRVQVSSGDNEVDEAAYQTSVMIGGHLFKGILYDQGGPSSASPGGGGEGSSAVVGMTAPGGFCGGADPPPPPPPSYSSNPNVTHDDHNNYTSFNASLLRPGMQFFPHPKP